MNVLASSSLRATRPALKMIQRRNIWVPHTVQPHTNTNHMPFNYLNKRAFTYKFASYLGFGFALPWVAVAWQWYKPGGFKASTA